MILLSSILSEEIGLMLQHYEQFGFRHKHTTTAQLDGLIERVIRNFGDKRLTNAIFIDRAKAFETVWVDGLLFKQPP
jgi:hypothetical protein